MKFQTLSIFLTGALLLAGRSHAQNAADAVTVNVVKYDVLKDAILKNRGKVVLVDFWGFF